jgi:hypothetical protein
VEIDLGTFDIANVMIHRMPKVKKGDKNPTEFEETLAEAPVNLTPDLKRFFRGRITTSIDRQSFVAVFDPPPTGDGVPRPGEEPSRVPNVLIDYFTDPTNKLVDASRELARELYRRQSGQNSAGLLVVADARVMSGKKVGACLVILKLEDDEALLVEPTTTADGLATFDASVRAVTLPDAAKVFKAALFPPARELAKLEAKVSDAQRDPNDFGDEIATFFLRFLGCKLRDTADRTTSAFVERAVEFANSITDEGTRADYMNLIMGEVKSASQTIDPRQIAKKLQPEHRDAFLDASRLPDGSIPLIQKDLSKVGSRLDNVLYEFAGGIKVWGPREAVQQMLSTKDGHWVIDSQLQKTSPTGRR